ncbi:MAG: hypothetical protein MJY60_05720 [Bacteroidales bacterium]|nr:hypothetical protein [Bacteroidales bacterium]
MKFKTLVFSLIAVAATILTGCHQEEDWGAADIKLDRTTLTFTADGGSETIYLTTTREWKAKDIPEWVIVDPESGKPSKEAIAITVTVPKNEGYNRRCDIDFNGGIVSDGLTITQEGPDGDNDGIVDGEAITVSEFITRADTQKEYVLEGKISNIANTSYYGFDLTDESGTIAIAFPLNFKDYVDRLKEDGIVKVRGKYQFYQSKQTHQMANGTILSYESPMAVNPDNLKTLTVKEFLDKADASKNYKLTGTVTNFNSEYCSFDLKDETGSINVYSLTNESKTQFGNQIANGGKVTLYGKYFWYESGKKAEIKNATILTYEAGVVETSTIEGLVMAVSAKSFVVKVGDSFQYVFVDAAPGVSVGDMVSVSGEKSTYNNLPQITKPQTTIKSSGNAVSYPAPTVLKGADVDSYSTGFGYVTVTGVLVKSGNYYNIEIPDSKRTGSIAYAAADYSSLVGKTIDATGFFAGISGGSYFNIVVSEVKESISQIDISLKHPLTSGCSWILGNKANDNTSTGSNKQSGTFNGTKVDNLVKLGTGSVGGDFTIKVPAGKSKVSFYCIGFSKDVSDNFPNTNGTAYSFTAAVGSDTKANVTVKRFIASGNPPFTINLKEDEDYYTIDLGAATTAETQLKITATGRMLFIGINAE